MMGRFGIDLASSSTLKRKLKIIESEAPEKIAFHIASTPRALRKIAARDTKIADVGVSNPRSLECAQDLLSTNLAVGYMRRRRWSRT